MPGSFDLLPTVEDFFTCSATCLQAESEEVNETMTLFHKSHALTEISKLPTSLKTLCGNFPIFRDRLLRLTGDNWTALRTAQYFVIRTAAWMKPNVNSQLETVKERQVFTRHLYLKPDDVWNVHDVIVAYDSIADELEAIADAEPTA